MTFVPSQVGISAITQANPAVVTTVAIHNLTTGQIVRLYVPQNYGMFPLNNQLYSVTVLSPTTFSIQTSQLPPAINVNSIYFPAFTTPSKPAMLAQVIAVGSGPTPLLDTPVSINNNTCISDVEDATINNSTVSIPF